ncbi:hypothetical protein QAD02_016942 [Eretmocerus hayati]|uniref:Uncharacterized protein n=1 Tax=Eretmocerus hayati TaxID=131215 RepID=A0ACC2PCL0_9HYME|nr:hypothetical protein QAD02_016942 [Eretmocerus hayati]
MDPESGEDPAYMSEDSDQDSSNVYYMSDNSSESSTNESSAPSSSITPWDLWEKFGNEGRTSPSQFWSMRPSPKCDLNKILDIDSPPTSPPSHYSESLPSSYRPTQIPLHPLRDTYETVIRQRSELPPPASPDPDIASIDDLDCERPTKQRRSEHYAELVVSIDLYSLVKAGKYEVVEKILDAGVEINPPSATALLHEAVKWGSKKMIESLIERNADINALDNDGKSILFHAIRHKYNLDVPADENVAILRLLLMRGAMINNGQSNNIYALAKRAIKYSNIDALRVLLQSGGFSLAKLNLWCQFKDEPLLHTAISNKNVRMLKYLIDSALFDINSQDVLGQTALHKAVCSNSLPHVNLLLGWQADINVKDHQGRTALDWALRLEFNEVVEKLLFAGTGIGLDSREALCNFVKTLNMDTRIRNPLILKHLLKHIALLKTYDYFIYSVDEYNKRNLSFKESSFANYFNNCMAEIKTMRESTFCDINTSCTVYDLLVDEGFDRCKKSTHPIRAIEIGTSKDFFSLYSKRIAQRINHLNNMQKLKERAKEGLRMILGVEIEGPCLVYSKILDNLHIEDLRSLRALTLVNDTSELSLI